MRAILKGTNENEIDIILELLIEIKDNQFIDQVIEICRKNAMTGQYLKVMN